MKCSDIDIGARTILQDPSAKRWTEANVYEWVHEGELELLGAAPRAASSTVNLDITQNVAQQTLPATYMALLDLVSNMGTDGATPGAAISRTTIDRMQAAKPTWRRDLGTAVRQYMQDERDPRLFYVWPRVSATTKAEARVVLLPVLCTDMADALVCSDEWKAALVEYVLYKAFSKDGADQANLNRAIAHYGNFARMAGIKLAGRSKAGPGGNSPVNPAYPAVEKNGA